MLVQNTLTHTFPSIVHAPDTTEIWHKLCDDFFAMTYGLVEHEDRLTILTWNNFESSPLERCLSLRGIPFVATGKNVEVWNNLQKFRLNLEVISKVETPYIMGLDAHDVLFVGSPRQAVEKFEKLDCDLLFNGETYFYPDYPIEYYVRHKKFQKDVGRSKYQFLNSGAWIGKRDFCRQVFEECIKIRLWELFDCSDRLRLFNCDQSVVHSMFTKYNPRITLDYQCDIFFNISRINPDEIKVTK